MKRMNLTVFNRKLKVYNYKCPKCGFEKVLKRCPPNNQAKYDNCNHKPMDYLGCEYQSFY